MVHYLDHNATTPIRPAALAAMSEALAFTGNASSVHAWGRRARKAVEDARECVAALVNAKPEEVVFTASGTEANNLALRGVTCATIYASAIEHPSVLKARDDIRPLDEQIEEGSLVSMMLANNETGAIQPVAEIAGHVKARNGFMHCDAVQAAGRIPVDFAALGVDLMSLSAHKIGGPQGVGALIVRDGVMLASILKGGGQERSQRAGTENVAGIVGFGVAAAEARDIRDLAPLRDRIEAALPEAVVFAADGARIPNTSCLAMPGVAAETQLMTFDLAGVMVSAGSACSSGKLARSHVLAAMGVADDLADCAIRVSLGWNSTDADVDAFVAAWRALYARTHREAA